MHAVSSRSRGRRQSAAAPTRSSRGSTRSHASSAETREDRRMTTPVLRFTRAVYVLGVCLTLGTGIGLFAFPARTADYWAWTIDAPLTAAFFGAAYSGAAVSLTLAARTPVWERTRVVAIAALTLTSLTIAATLRDTGPFAFHEGGL